MYALNDSKRIAALCRETKHHPVIGGGLTVVIKPSGQTKIEAPLYLSEEYDTKLN